MPVYNHQNIEKKWQKYWQKKNIFKAEDESSKPKFYCLDMFPYPSSYGLHVGHLRGYTISDIIAKKRLMEGYNVLHPMGWDAFGLPAENFALKTGVHPATTTQKAIKNIKKQLISSGLGYDWSREICSCSKDYYQWTQWMFLELYKAGLAYRKKAEVNFCPSCKTVLANEQVIDGKCERCQNIVSKKQLEQWFFKITDYAERLIDDLDKIDWPDKIKIMQRNWIGKSEGTEIIFQIPNSEFQIPVFTTRVDTLFGCTYIVIAPESSIIKQLKPKISNYKEVLDYTEKAKTKSETERLAEDKEKTGVEIKGIKAINPINNEEVPIFVADYVLTEYGTGAIMAVPAHDERDFLFAKKYNLSVKEVIQPVNSQTKFPEKAFEDDGVLINSGVFTGLSSLEAREKIIQYLSEKKLGKKAVYYKLRDWLISRQRYWGAPIPMIFCPKCGWQAVAENDLPVLLPKIKDFKPGGEGESPLVKSKKFLQTKCPKCGGLAKRETDTMDTFVCSSWYYLAYAFWHKQKNQKGSILKEHKNLIKFWLPVDLYVGGAEHACLHLLYARFFVKALKDLGYIDFDEAFSKLFNQGTIYHEGAKMSKSRGNVVSPDEIFKKYGADILRVYELFIGPADQACQWQDKGIIGSYRFLQKVWQLLDRFETQSKKMKTTETSLSIKKLLHKTIKQVTEDIESFKFNTAISSLMVLTNEMEKAEQLAVSDYELLIKLVAPFAPHLSEEIWQRLGHKASIFFENWPKYDKELVKEEKFIFIIQINGKIRDKVEIEKGISREKVEEIVFSREKTQKWIKDKEIKKIIFVPDKLINLVI